MTYGTEVPDLLPCPFCGCAPVELEHAKMVRCRDANCPLGQRWSSMDKWNTRADLSDAKDARIAELEAERRRKQNELDKLADDFTDMYHRADEAEAKLAKAETTLTGVEEWWLETGMHEFAGAPACIFKVRATLAELTTTPTERETP